MTETNPPTPDAPFLRSPQPKGNAEPAVSLPRLLLGLGLGVAFFDVCFWNIPASPGLSLGVFFTALAALILASASPSGDTRRLRWMAVLLLGAVFETIVETCFTNTLVLLTLTVALAGEAFFGDVASPWGRWLSQVVALFFAPGRIFWLGGRLMQAANAGGIRKTGGLLGGCLLALPALVLALIFGSLLSMGNAVFGSWASSSWTWLTDSLARCLDPWRIITWVFVAFALLPLLRPARVSARWWQWTENLPRLPELLPSGAFFSSAMILVVLNLLFLVANIADALFLWSGQALPKDVDYKDYVHEGVNAFIVTVILSAIVLTAIFQQDLKVAQRKELKLLAYLWIAQNLFLIISVTEKLRGFIVTYQMTVARLSTIIFLILVFLGFVLLTIKIAREKSISWLIGGCVLAVFGTFYITQFLDLAGWSANYNVAVMEKDPGHIFDSKTMCLYNSDVWPALRRAHDLAPQDPNISASWQAELQSIDLKERTRFDWQHWRTFGLRAWMNRPALEEKPNN